MAIYIQVFGGEGVLRTTERLFTTSLDAATYLAEYGVPRAGAEAPRGTSFQHRSFKFLCSHPYQDIISSSLKNPPTTLPDNKLSSSAAERMGKGLQPALSPGVTARTPSRTSSPTSTSSAKTADTDKKKPKPGIPLPPNTTVPPTGADGTGPLVNLKQICRKIDLDPRVARQKLRKLYPGNDKQRWEWSSRNATVIESLLS